jgi:hypothetical protein
MKIVISIFFTILLIGCGYKPTTYYVKQQSNKKIYVDVSIGVKIPKNSIYIKDALCQAAANKLNATLVYNKSQADATTQTTLKSTSLSQIQFDEQGYAKLYRVSVSLDILYKDDDITKKFTMNDSYDFSITSDAVVSEAKKTEAIKIAASKAFNRFLSNLAVSNATINKSKHNDLNTTNEETNSTN